MPPKVTLGGHGAFSSEGEAGENQERPCLVALRGRHGAELQVVETVDVASFDRKATLRTEPRAAAQDRRIGRLGASVVGTGRATTGVAVHLKRELRTSVRVWGDAGRRKSDAQVQRHIDVVELPGITVRVADHAALRVESLDAEPDQPGPRNPDAGCEAGAVLQRSGQQAAVRHVAVRKAAFDSESALRARPLRQQREAQSSENSEGPL